MVIQLFFNMCRQRITTLTKAAKAVLCELRVRNSIGCLYNYVSMRSRKTIAANAKKYPRKLVYYQLYESLILVSFFNKLAVYIRILPISVPLKSRNNLLSLNANYGWVWYIYKYIFVKNIFTFHPYLQGTMRCVIFGHVCSLKRWISKNVKQIYELQSRSKLIFSV